jgi:hypothetical protein
MRKNGSWNKGLTKDDPRVLKSLETRRQTLEDKKNGIVRPKPPRPEKVMSPESREARRLRREATKARRLKKKLAKERNLTVRAEKAGQRRLEKLIKEDKIIITKRIKKDPLYTPEDHNYIMDLNLKNVLTYRRTELLKNDFRDLTPNEMTVLKEMNLVSRGPKRCREDKAGVVATQFAIVKIEEMLS